ncbi:tRNA threonylcarbamoyl adenosine modification protein YeaZ [Shimia isoporae]|uniref:tRNA threonylcarbamoyl adenosine modification protein YeaZ n=1 Tax=Shimia isoporae TaxID=647720 RepID=A0A4R1NJV6_9RHOB|nr:tRNA (adenosine(37)-N6)-threonylcarbamoyltransferase complex dimerization subunit type 1 TsaB [Shimia isoporae]TCL08576.1 tRNA threonylcarbamoyl adenosine modification protein YeaZ [Shimia isoporae]
MTTAPLILGFDTSGPHVSAALRRGDETVALASEDMKRGQAERLMPLLEGTLAKADCSWTDLSAIGVGVGPGNFTGIRISVSAARGLALGLGIPAVGVSSFQAISLDQAERHIATVPAPRDQVYALGEGYPEPKLVPLSEIDTALARPLPAAAQLVTNIARIAAAEFQKNPPRPAPLYIKPADAAPPRDPAPVILDA